MRRNFHPSYYSFSPPFKKKNFVSHFLLLSPPYIYTDAGRVYRSLSSVLSQDSSLREELIDQFGFSIKEVRVSPDHAKAFILWDSYNGQAAGAERALRRTTPRLRAAVARAMKARNVPRLEFRLDRVSEQDSELERVFARLEQEREAEERESGILNE